MHSSRLWNAFYALFEGPFYIFTTQHILLDL